LLFAKYLRNEKGEWIPRTGESQLKKELGVLDAGKRIGR
jgi:hypothetical protein